MWRKFWVFVALAALLALPAWADGTFTLEVIKELTQRSPAPATPWEFTVTRVFDDNTETLIGKFYLPPTGGQFSLQVQSGSYKIAETLKSGYTCVAMSDNVIYENETLEAGYYTIELTVTANVTVTFTNDAQPGTLTVKKTVIGTPPAQTDSWTFTVKKGTEVYAVLSIRGTGGPVTLNIPKEETNKTYTIIETTKEGYLCTVDGQATNQKSILLAPGDNKTVEFVNIQTPVTITVVKEVLGPAPEQDWEFEVVGQSYSFSFTLPAEGGQTQLLVPAGTYTITEAEREGYFCTVDNVQTRSCTVTVGQNESKTVTFVNTAYATIKVVKVVQGQTPSEPWVFTLKTDNTVQTFSIAAGGGTYVVSTVKPGTYTIIETPKPNYVCTVDGQITNEVTITVGPGEVKTVTFVNTRGANTQANTFGAGWNLLSVPLVPAPNSPAAVFGDDVSPLYIFWWDPDQGKYITPTSIDPGRGYWLLLFGTTEIDVTGTAWTEDYEVQLGKAGWHMISTPTINVFWGYCKFRVGNVTKTLSEAVEEEWILPFFWQYDTTTGQYVALGANPEDVLRPWVGYWIKTLVDNVTVILPIKYMLTNPPVPPAGLALLGVGLPQETPPAPPSFAALAKDLLTVLAYPNPATANVVTFRALGLPVEGIRVSVFDLGGRKVWAGEAAGHELAWNLADSSGQPLANGVYLYVVEARLSGQWVSMGLNRLLILR